MKIVIKIGGSVLFPDEGPDKNYIKKLLPVLQRIKKENQLIVCVGAGRYLKNYAHKVREFLSDRDLELLFIDLLKRLKVPQCTCERCKAPFTLA